MGVSAGRNRLVFLRFRASSRGVISPSAKTKFRTENGEFLIHAMNLAGLQLPRLTITCD